MAGYLLTIAIMVVGLTLVSQIYSYTAYATYEDKLKKLGIEYNDYNTMKEVCALTQEEPEWENSASQSIVTAMPCLDSANSILVGSVAGQDYHAAPTEQYIKTVGQSEELKNPLPDPAKNSNSLQTTNTTYEQNMQMIDNNHNQTTNNMIDKEWAQSFCMPFCD